MSYSDSTRIGPFHCLLQAMARHDIVANGKHLLARRMQFDHQHRWRSVSASICLLVVVLLYSPLAGAAWISYESSCCTSEQCRIPEHHHQKSSPAPHDNMDCSHDMPGMMACSMSCCHDSDRSMVMVIAFVLPPVVAVAVPSAIQSPIEFAKPLDFLRSIKPASPPPRFLVAVA